MGRRSAHIRTDKIDTSVSMASRRPFAAIFVFHHACGISNSSRQVASQGALPRVGPAARSCALNGSTSLQHLEGSRRFVLSHPSLRSSEAITKPVEARRVEQVGNHPGAGSCREADYTSRYNKTRAAAILGSAASRWSFRERHGCVYL